MYFIFTHLKMHILKNVILKATDSHETDFFVSKSENNSKFPRLKVKFDSLWSMTWFNPCFETSPVSHAPLTKPCLTLLIVQGST